jgi:hypothetical protein
MKHFSKRAIAPVLFVVIAGIGFGQTFGDFNYHIEGNDASRTITITGYTGGGSDIVIPASINGIPVTHIGERAFNGINLTSISIPEGVTHIEGGAFDRNSYLSEIIVPADISYDLSAMGFSEGTKLKKAYERYGRKAGIFVQVGMRKSKTWDLLSSEEIEEALARETPAAAFYRPGNYYLDI